MVTLQQLTLFGLLVLAPVSAHASVTRMTYNNQTIIHVGTEHAHDPNHYQYAVLHNAWQEFLQKSAGQPRCVVIEHPTVPTIRHNSLNTAITEYADWGAAFYLAQQHQIPVVAGNPLVYQAFKDIAESKKFNPDHVRYAFFAQSLEMYNRLKQNSSIVVPNDYLENKIAKIFPNTSLDEMIQLHKRITNRPFDKHDYHFYEYVTKCRPMLSLRAFFYYKFPALKEIHQIMDAYYIKRDIGTLVLIKEQLKSGKHVFIVYGRYHQAFHIQGIQKIIAGVALEESAT